MLWFCVDLLEEHLLSHTHGLHFRGQFLPGLGKLFREDFLNRQPIQQRQHAFALAAFPIRAHRRGGLIENPPREAALIAVQAAEIPISTNATAYLRQCTRPCSDSNRFIRAEGR